MAQLPYTSHICRGKVNDGLFQNQQPIFRSFKYSVKDFTEENTYINYISRVPIYRDPDNSQFY